MKVKEVMTQSVETVRPEASLRDAACKLAELDAGVLPVEDGDRLIGIITDRDIAIRGVGAGKGPDALVRDVMSNEVKYAFDDEHVDAVAANMADQQVRRLPVVDRDKRLVGIVSLADIAGAGERGASAKALEGVTRPGGLHSQSNGEART